jgi:hypothetical protein
MPKIGAAILVFIPLAILSPVPAGAEDSPQNIEVSVQAPLRVKDGESFEIRARVRNTADEVQTLVDLDFSDRYLNGIAIESASPRFSEGTSYPEEHTFSYTFNLPVQPGAEAEIVLQARAVSPGDYSAELDFCINSPTSYLSYPIRTIVK